MYKFFGKKDEVLETYKSSLNSLNSALSEVDDFYKIKRTRIE